jgi:hypothetical protein
VKLPANPRRRSQLWPDPSAGQGRAHEKGVGYRNIDCPPDIQAVVGAVLDIALAGKSFIGFFGGKQYGATNRVTTVQGTLRAAQHFYLLEVDHVKNRPDGARQKNPIDINANAGVGSGCKVLLADTANKHHSV